MWIIIAIIVMVLIMGVNIGWQFRDWHYKKWLEKTKYICPRCKGDNVKEEGTWSDMINMWKYYCRSCNYFWSTTITE